MKNGYQGNIKHSSSQEVKAVYGRESSQKPKVAKGGDLRCGKGK